MKKFLVLAVLLGGCDLGLEIGSGTVDSQVRPLVEIEGVEAEGGFDVEVRQGAELDLVEVTCDDNLISNITTDVLDGILVIGTEHNQRSKADCHVMVKTTSAIASVGASGSGVFTLVGPGSHLTSVSLSGSGSVVLTEGAGDNTVGVEISGSGSVELGTIRGDLTASLSGSGSIEADGDINNLEVTISGSGSAHLTDLTAMNGDIALSGSGQAEITTTNSVHVRITGSGSCEVHGQPTDRDVDVTGSGTVDFQ